MFTEYINRILESERDFGSNRQEEVTTPDVIEKSSIIDKTIPCLLYTSPSPRDRTRSRMPSSA